MDFECLKLALWPTLRQLFERLGDKHDKEISNCSSTPQTHREYIFRAILLNETVSNSDDLILHVLKAITS